jgi:hypothetical protein
MYCEDCGRALPADNPYWKLKCLSCFKRSKRVEEHQITAQARATPELQLRYDHLYEQYRKLIVVAMEAAQQVEALERELKTARQQKATPEPSLSFGKDMLKKLLLLCHPDKHANSALSNEVTRYLLGLRK